MTFDEATSIFVLVMTAILLGWRYRPRALLGRLGATILHLARQFTYVTSVEAPLTNAAPPVEQRSDAVEQPSEPSGTEDRNDVPGLVEQLEALDDDTLLDILAGVRGADGEYRFAESRVAKFIGGRVEDRLAQVTRCLGDRETDTTGPLIASE